MILQDPALACDFFELLEEVFEARDGALWRALIQIAEGPHRVLRTDYRLTAVGTAASLAPDRLLDSLIAPGSVLLTERRAHFVSHGQRWRFLKAVAGHTRLDYDTLPNRVTAFFVRQTIQQLRQIAKILHSVAGQNSDWDEIREDAQAMRRRLQGILQHHDALAQATPLRHVPTDNLALNHHPLYRQVLHALSELAA